MMIGMTGTRHGATEQQKVIFAQLLDELNAGSVSHGDCIGADEDAHIIAMNMDLFIYIHPPTKPDLRAWCDKYDYYEQTIYPKKGYIPRNHDIVDSTDILIGISGTTYETPRGGTWSTIRYAKDKGNPVYVIYPYGRVDSFNVF